MDRVAARDDRDAADLVERIRSGDRQAEAEVFNRYRRGVSAILMRQGLSADIADDLLHETITIVFQKIKDGKVEKPDSLSALICAIAKNLAISHFRKDSRVILVEDAGIEIPCPPDLHEQLLRKEEARIVRRVIAELKTERDREILLRYYLGEEDKEQICADLGLSSLHFNRVLHRALQRFKELFENHCKELKRKPANTMDGSK